MQTLSLTKTIALALCGVFVVAIWSVSAAPAAAQETDPGSEQPLYQRLRAEFSPNNTTGVRPTPPATPQADRAFDPSLKDIDNPKEVLDRLRARVEGTVHDSSASTTMQEHVPQQKEGRGPVVEAIRAYVTTIRTDIREALAERRETLEQRRTELREELRAHATERATEAALRMLERMEHRIDDLAAILDRVATRAQALADRGVATATVGQEVAEARTALAEAQDAVGDVQETIREAVASGSPGEYVSDIRAAVRTAIEALKDAHQAVGESVRALRGLIDTLDPDSDDDGVADAD